METNKNLEREGLYVNVIFVIILLVAAFLVGYTIGNTEDDEQKLNSSSVIEDDEMRSIYKSDMKTLCIDNVFTRETGGKSMIPSYYPGDEVILRKISNYSSISKGDIVVYREKVGGELINMLVGHRVVEKGEDENGLYFITKGDNNNHVDRKIRAEQIQSVVAGVIY